MLGLAGLGTFSIFVLGMNVLPSGLMFIAVKENIYRAVFGSG